MPKKNDAKTVATKHALLNAVQHGGMASEGVVVGKVLGESPEMKKDMKALVADVKAAVSEVNSWPTEKQDAEMKRLKIDIDEGKAPEKEEGELPPLPNATPGKVVMRMAPYPSGPLHIGNARMAILNDEYVRRYKGILFLVYDDTIGSEEKKLIPEGYALVREGLQWLGVKFGKELYKSDRLEIFYKHAEELLKKKLAYVCLCSADELRTNREAATECLHRGQTAAENLKLWKKMMDGGFKEGEAVVRLKTDMKYPNPAFRDRVLLRVSDREHVRVGHKYHVWPMLEFSWAVDDHELGMTHILRGKDLVMEDLMETFIWEKLGWNKPEFLHYGLLRLAEAKLSKSKSRAAIEAGAFAGWEDPRTWSLQSLRRRGIRPEAIRRFVLSMGLSLSDVTVPADIFYAENRKIIDSDARRYFAVFNPVKISIEDVPAKLAKTKDVVVPAHPENKKLGERKIPLNLGAVYVERHDLENLHGRRIGLMNLFSVELGDNVKFSSEEIEMSDQKTQWVSEPNVSITVVMPDGESRSAVAEPDIAKAKVDDVVQLVRFGFCRVDKAGKDMVLYFAHK
ncbi:MAG: glutamate--tRNA ligase [Candidatus Aenigmarchaeota archaeon]|nr:glutamate--tRNA ligase [Candidatus Aenigmarchaeota archaeon]